MSMRLLALLALLLPIGCHEAAPAPVTPSPPTQASPVVARAVDAAPAARADPAEAALGALAGKLAAVRAAPADKAFSDGGDSDVSPLVGVSAARVRAALGEPRVCGKDDSTIAKDARHPMAPCRAEGDWFYSFYRLPTSSVGGGPELLLQFDASGICTLATWRHTQ